MLESVEYSRKTFGDAVAYSSRGRRDLVVDVVEVGVHGELEAVGVVLPCLPAVRARVVVRVADEVQERLAVIPADRLHRVARADVEFVRALDHVRPGGDDITAVFARLPLEALRDLLRDGASPWQAEPVREVAGVASSD